MIDEARRHALYQRLEQVRGQKEANVFMEHLPPVGWADVATKEYVDLRLEATEEKLGSVLKAETAAIRNEITRQTRAVILSVVALAVTSILGVAGVTVSMAQLLS